MIEKKYKLKVNGKESEVTRAQLLEELEREVGEDGILDLVKLKRGSYERFEQSKKVQTQLQQYEALLKNPQATFSEMARRIGPEKAAQVIEQQYKEIERIRKMTPEQRQQWMEHQQYLADKARVEQEKRRLEAQEKKQAKQRVVETTRQQFTSALTELGIPANQSTVGRMAMHAKEMLAKGITPTYKDLAKAVKEDIRTEMRVLIKALKAEELRDYLGDEHLKSIQQMRMEALEEQAPRPGAMIPRPRDTNGKFVPIKGKGGQEPETPKRKIPIGEWKRMQIEERRKNDSRR